MKYAYFVTAVQEKTLDSKTFGFYFNLEEAKEAVIKNIGAMEECVFDYVVIEKYNEKIFAIGEQVQWFIWHTGAKRWVKYDKQPDFALGFINFAIA